jgi:hypothetical protein
LYVNNIVGWTPPAGAGTGNVTAIPGGTIGYVPYFTSATNIANSGIFWEVGSNEVGINDNTPSTALDITGAIHSTGDITNDSDIHSGNDLSCINDLNVGDNIIITGQVGSNLTATANSTYDLGTAAILWEDIYVENLHAGTVGGLSPFQVIDVLDMTNHQIKNVADPTDNQDVVTKAYGNANYLGGSGDMTKAVYDPDLDNIVENADYATTTGTAGYASTAGDAATLGSKLPPLGNIVGTNDSQAITNKSFTTNNTFTNPYINEAVSLIATSTQLNSAASLVHTQNTDTALGILGTKNPPIDADKAIYRDSVVGDALVTSTWAQVKAFLKTYFDGLYGTGSGNITANGATNYIPKFSTSTNITNSAISDDGSKITFTENITLSTNYYINNVHDPSQAQDVATKNYVDTRGYGTGNITASLVAGNIPVSNTSTNLTNSIMTANTTAITIAGTGQATRFFSTQTNGTAPFQVTSTTNVTNLNTDLHDGAHASATATANTIPISDGNTYLNQTWLGSGAADSTKYLRGDQTWSTPAGGSNPSWYGHIYGAYGSCDPGDMLRMMQKDVNVAATPTAIKATVARCSFFRPPANITVDRIRFYGVGVTTGIYRVALYSYNIGASTGTQLVEVNDFNTAANAWGVAGSNLNISLTAGTLYFIAVSVDTTSTTAGIACWGDTTAAKTGTIQTAPQSLPGNLDADAGYINGYNFQFTIVGGDLPATTGTLAAQTAVWTGGMPAFFLDANDAS